MVGMRFREIKEQNKMSKEQLAEKINESIEDIFALEEFGNGKLELLVKYSQFFKVSCDYLLGISR